MTKRAIIVVSGFVQGVYYRYRAKRQADGLGVRGTAENLPTGQVRIVCEGEEREVNALIEWARTGPEGAIVDKVDVEWQPPSGLFGGFSILY